jgi:hypothetical protein
VTDWGPSGLAQLNARHHLGDTVDQAEQAEKQSEGDPADVGRANSTTPISVGTSAAAGGPPAIT